MSVSCPAPYSFSCHSRERDSLLATCPNFGVHLKILDEADAERLKAKQSATAAEDAREQIIAEAKQKGEAIVDQARIAAQEQLNALRRQALTEIKSVLARIETIRAATEEELEAQRIFASVAKLKAGSVPYWAELELDPNEDLSMGSGVPSNGASETESAVVATAAPANGHAGTAADGAPPSSVRKTRKATKKKNKK